MISLRNVTLLSFTTSDYAGVRRAVDRCTQHCEFNNVVIFTDKAEEFPGWEHVIHIDPIKPEEVAVVNICTIPQFRYLFADFTLTIHWDSWVVNPDAWTDDFFNYDYIGAVWQDGTVGNDGFCLKSRKLMDEIAALPVKPTPAECRPSDILLCKRKKYEYYPELRCFRDELEEKGIKYAPPEVADRFSIEDKPYAGSFGFHGHKTLLSLHQKGLL